MKILYKIGVILLIFALNMSNFAVFNKFNINQTNAIKTSAESMITIEASTNRVLYHKDENKKLPMASTTKILTALVAIENCDDLDKKHKIPKEAVGIEGSSIYLKEGEHLSVRELLYGLMLRSGNDSAVAIAIIVGGSVKNFINMMNKYCENLGLTNTNIVTVNGLHDENHYTTAYELALITSKALKNEIFADIVSTKQKTISNELGKDDYRFLKNKNRFLNMIDGADGVKTGYTKKAGRCFVGSATKNGMQVICVVLNCVSMFEECARLISQAFEEYELVTLFKTGKILDVEIELQKTQKIPILVKKDIILPLKQGEIVNITANLNINNNLMLPVLETQPIGDIEIRFQNNLIFSDKIYTINIAKCNDVKDNFHKLIKAF